MESFAPLLMAIFPHDVWMALWEAYGDPKIPPFLGDIISLANLVMVPQTIGEIKPADAHFASTSPIPAKNSLDLVQQKITCLPTLALWDDFLPDITGLFVESHIEDVGDIIDGIDLLFFEETSSLVARVHSKPQPLDYFDIIVDIYLHQMEKESFTYEESYKSL